MSRLLNLASVASVASLASVLLFGGAQAATQITLGADNTSTGTFVFTGNGAGTTSLTVSTAGLTGPAFFTLANPGSFSLGAVAPFITGPINGSGQYSLVGMTESFVFNAGLGEHLDGTINFTTLTDHSNTPRFNGNLVINLATLAGDAAFKAAFASGMAAIDFNIGPLGALLDSLNGTTGSLSAGLSSGEVVPTPAPAALPLFLTGLAGLWVASRRRRKVQPAFS